MKQLPWWPFYPGEWLADQAVTLMTPAQEGAYIRLLCHAWNDPGCGVPADRAQFCQLARLDPTDTDSFSKLAACFSPHPRKKSQVISRWLYAEWQRVKQTQRVKQRAANVRWQSKRNAPALHVQSDSELDSELESDLDKAKKKSGRDGSGGTALPDGEWLDALKVNRAYQGIDIDREYAKAQTWCAANRKVLTRKRFVNWLNRVDRPMTAECCERPRSLVDLATRRQV